MIEQKYIKLLLERCLNLAECNAIFIDYNKINKDFVDKIVDYLNNLGNYDIYLNENDTKYIHDLLTNIKKEDVKNQEVFNSKIWDDYAKKNAAFLLLDAEIPHEMDDIDTSILAEVANIKRNTKPIYREKQLKGEIPWCIAGIPNIYWAEEIFPKSKKPLEEFWLVLSQICMLNEENPIEAWNNWLEKQNKIISKLNSLEIKKLYYKNNLGTDLVIELPKNSIWQSASSKKWIVNMPSYEVFTTPDYRKTNGTVYSSMPLLYNGKIVNNFKITFKDGKVIEYDAKEGKDVLKEIIDGEELSSYLGEVALVDYNSPISNTKVLFKSTLYDENASCHLALGSGFTECIPDGENKTKEELQDLGINTCKNHVDFMIGTKDLIIKAETIKGTITIMENGNLII